MSTQDSFEYREQFHYLGVVQLIYHTSGVGLD